MKRLGIAVLVLVAFIFFNNSTLFVGATAGRPTLLSHRGVSQQFDRTDVKNDTCTASRMLAPTHGLLENTLPSMQASFAAGADIVEFDVHPTTDGEFAVFHDWTLDCRTDGTGVTREHTMADLRRLDVGYGYTADGGRTFPFRGKGVGLLPSLTDVLTSFPNRRFLINVKSNDPREGKLLAAALRARPEEQVSRIMVYGGDEPIRVLRDEMPNLQVMSRQTLKSCLLSYIGYGWTGLMPSTCRNSVMYVPLNFAPWLWGWPDRFLGRMRDAGSAVFVIGPYTGGEFSSGVDTIEDVGRLPANFAGGVMTNEIELVGPMLARGADAKR